MGNSAEYKVEVYKTGHGPQMIVSVGGDERPVFAADIMEQGRTLDCVWPSQTPLSVFRNVVEQHNSKVEWIDGRFVLRGKAEKGDYSLEVVHVFEGYVPRATRSLSLTGKVDINSVLLEIAHIASETVIQPVSLEPGFLFESLSKFIVGVHPA